MTLESTKWNERHRAAHTFVIDKGGSYLSRICGNCNVMQNLTSGLIGTPLDREPRPHHDDPPHTAWEPWCQLCGELKAWVEKNVARGRMK